MLLLVPGFGEPHVAHKAAILKSNIQRVRTTCPLPVDIKVFAYDTAGRDAAANTDVTVVHERGIAGDFLLRHARPEQVASYSHIMILLDDVELREGVDVARMLALQATHSLDLISPCLTPDSHTPFAYMRELKGDGVALVSACELFCYLFDTNAYVHKYFAHLTHESPFLWGMDLTLAKHLGLRVGMVPSMRVRHHYAGGGQGVEGDPRRPERGYVIMFARFGTSMEELSRQPAVLRWCR